MGVGNALRILNLIDASTCYHDTNKCEEGGVLVTHAVGSVSLGAQLFFLLSLQQSYLGIYFSLGTLARELGSQTRNDVYLN